DVRPRAGEPARGRRRPHVGGRGAGPVHGGDHRHDRRGPPTLHHRLAQRGLQRRAGARAPPRGSPAQVLGRRDRDSPPAPPRPPPPRAAPPPASRPAPAPPRLRPPRPNVLLLIDSSGSMENMPDGRRPEAASATCNPGTATPMNRWATLVTALTGSIQNFSC